MANLDPDALEVSSFSTSSSLPGTELPGYCCTGCVSGCGINPTASGCASASGDVMCYPQDAAY